MPEYVEALSSCLLAQHWFNSVKNSSPLLLKAMYADATLDEQRKSKDPLVKMGLPYPLAPDSKVKRGPRLAQNPIYPPISCSVQDAAFQLKDVVFNPRSVLLLLESSSSDPAVAGTWWMQVCDCFIRLLVLLSTNSALGSTLNTHHCSGVYIVSMEG